jgi:hypothetical protein
MIRDKKGHLYLVDWEQAGIRPIAYYILNVFKRYPKLRLMVMDLLTKLSSSLEHNINCRLQLAIVIANQSLFFKKEKSKLIKYFVLSLGMSYKKVIEKFYKEIDFNKKLIDDLFGNYNGKF